MNDLRGHIRNSWRRYGVDHSEEDDDGKAVREDLGHTIRLKLVTMVYFNVLHGVPYNTFPDQVHTLHHI